MIMITHLFHRFIFHVVLDLWSSFLKMDSGELDRNGKCVEELFSEKLVPLNSPDTSDMFGDQQVHPRVGDKYQVKIPRMITESERLHLLRNPDDTEINFNVSHYFVLGLAVPAIWVDDKINNNQNKGIKVYKKRDDSVNAKGSVGSKKVKKRQHISNKEGLKAKTLDVALDCGKESKSISEPAMAGKGNPNQMCRSKSCCLVPGLLGDSPWTDIEFSSFLLALYIFEKNLVQVKRFMKSKEMGEILSFYYGKFYGSDEHRRYADCRKMMKSRKCKIGQRIFTGWRQQELLSRLLLHVSEDAKSTLVEVSKAFAEGRTSLEEYVHTLKTLAGIPVLIEAVGIGRGKEDLTSLAMEPTKTNLVFPFRPKIPVGKACSSLAFEDIVKFLTGDFRLSKAQLNDIFWEAVWPRLLERGWHSEQPKNHDYYSSKHQLVFLMPGVKKFSRRKLVKGDHYFDSVRDVLSRVASEPKLIKLEDEEPRVSSCEEVHEREPEPTINHDDPADHQQLYYLKPRVSTYNPNLLRLTVVDTSLACGEKSSKVRELRNLPSDTGITSILSNHSKESDGDSSGDSVDVPDSVVMLLKGQKKPRSSNHSKGMVDNSNSNQRMSIDDSKAAKKLVGNHHYQDPDLSNAKQLRTIKNCFSRRVRPGRSNLLPPLTKQRTLAACAKDDTSCSMEKFMVGSGFTQVEPSFRSNSLDVSKVGPFDEKKVLSTSSSLEGSPKKDSNKGILHENMYGTGISLAECEKPQSQPLIDLNVLQGLSDSENGEICDTKVDESQKNPNANVLCFSSDKYELVKEPNNLCTSSNVNAAEKHLIGSPRRQSTRNRPLTTRALEALAFGYLSTKRKRKGTENQRQDNPVSKHSCKAHIRADVTSNSGSISSGILDDKDQNGVDGVCKGSKSTVSNSLSETERKVALELVEISKATYHPGVLNFNDD
ncbi:hypothetical protein CsSME_00023350 [Camellia sinensis var. sinensis]